MVSSRNNHAELPTSQVAVLFLLPTMTNHFPPLQDKKITEILTTAGNIITLTLIPTVIYEHMVKK